MYELCEAMETNMT